MNTDVFEYESDAEMALYGAIPLFVTYSFWLISC